MPQRTIWHLVAIVARLLHERNHRSEQQMISPLRDVLILSGWLTFAAYVPAQDIPGYPSSYMAFDPREIALLPPYCKYTIYFRDKVPGGANAAERQRWVEVLGPTFEALHHYCFAMMKTNRAILLARDARVKQFYLTDSISEFDYVIERSSEDFVLLPEILTKKGENLFRLNRAPVALLVLERAAELRPDYWPPFAHLSDHFKSLGDVAMAREWVERGLVGSPDAVALSRRLKELTVPANLSPKASK